MTLSVGIVTLEAPEELNELGELYERRAEILDEL